MKTTKESLVIGNWKMNPQTEVLAKRLATEVKKVIARVSGVTVVLAPPTLYIPAVRSVQNGSNAFRLGVQNTHWEKLGAHTGEISHGMLKSFDISYVIVGHSERRNEGETNEMVHAKIVATIKNNMRAVVCVGERERDHGAQYLNLIEDQIRSAFAGIPKSKLEQLIIAYEPVWAIGTGDNASPADVHEMELFIEKILSDLYGRTYAQKVCILYGGSVSAKNAKEIMEEGAIDGFLLGTASLSADEFGKIVKVVAQIS